MAAIYHTTGFHFSLAFPDLHGEKEEALFAELSGLSARNNSAEVQEDGSILAEPRYPPGAFKHELTLKYGLYEKPAMARWIRQSGSDITAEPKEMHITLLNDKQESLIQWSLINACPVSWIVNESDSTEDICAVELLKVKFQDFSTIKF